MSAQGTGDLDAGALPRVARWALALWAALLVVTLPCDRRAAAAIALGGAISLGSFQCYRVLVPAWVRRSRPRLARIGLPALSLAKWPVLWVMLSWAVGTQGLSAEWLCVGLGLIPAAVTALAISAVAVEVRHGRPMGAGR